MAYASSRLWPQHFLVCLDEARGEQFRALAMHKASHDREHAQKNIGADDLKYARICWQADAQIVFTMDG